MQTKDGFCGLILMLTYHQSIRKELLTMVFILNTKTKQTQIVFNHKDGGRHGCHDGNHPPSSGWLVQMIDIIMPKIRTRLLFKC